MLRTGKNSVVVLYHKDLPKKTTGTIRNIRSLKASGKAITYLELWQAQVKLDCIFHLGWNQVFKKLFWRERRVSQPEGFMSPCVLWRWLPPCLLLNWMESCLCTSYTLASILILVFQQPQGRIMRDKESPKREKEGFLVLFLGITRSTRAMFISLMAEKCCGTSVRKWFQNSFIADTPKLCVTPGKLRDFPEPTGFTGSLASSSSAKCGSVEATMMEKHLNLLCTG